MSTRKTQPELPWSDSAAWHAGLAALVDALGSANFLAELLQTVARLAPGIATIAFLFRRHDVPLVVYHDLPPQEVGANIDRYLAGAYLLSPLYAAHARDLHGFFHLSEIAPDDFLHSDYYRTYYLGTGLVDEMVCAARLSPASHLILSLGQSERVFSRGELERLRAIGGLVTALVRRHGAIAFADREAPPAEGSMLHRQVTHVFNNFGRNLLTAREREVAVLVLRGYSLKAAAAALGIAFGTIKVHSKNLYAKLGIASQSELFSLFIEVMARAESLAAEDPLEAYRRSLRSG